MDTNKGEKIGTTEKVGGADVKQLIILGASERNKIEGDNQYEAYVYYGVKAAVCLQPRPRRPDL